MLPITPQFLVSLPNHASASHGSPRYERRERDSNPHDLAALARFERVYLTYGSLQVAMCYYAKGTD